VGGQLKKTRAQSNATGVVSRRSTIVWLSFAAAMTLAAGLLTVGDTGFAGGFLTASRASVVEDGTLGDDPLFNIDAPLDRERWSGIVIHHLGRPGGDAEWVHSLHLRYGYQGLGYHFLIGNGNGLGDGIIHVGYRWNEQLPGAHVVGPMGDRHNRRSIGICLIGNGDRRPFTEKQMRSLASLVQRLQAELDIPADAVHLHHELATGESSPGRFFAAARLRQQLLD
jgi:hypothetical protein